MNKKPTPLVLLLHGWLGSSKSLTPLSKELEKMGYLTMSIDLPGFGKASNPPKGAGIDYYSKYVENICTQQVKKGYSIIILGHSFGGAIALDIASRNPNYLEKLIVIAPSYKRIGEKLGTVHQSVFAKLFTLLPLLIQKILYKIVYPKSERYARIDLKTNFEKILQTDLASQVENIRIQTLIISGSNDDYVPLKYSLELEKLIKTSKLVVKTDARHNLPLTQFDWCAKEVGNFLIK